MRISIASSGLGHVARGIEAWASDLATALHARGEDVRLYQGGGVATAPYAKVLRCWQRDRSAVSKWWFPSRLLWRRGYGSPWLAEQTTFAHSLIKQLRREPADVLHVQDPHVALKVQHAGLKTKVILAHGTEEADAFLMQFDSVQHLAPWHLEQAKARGCWKPAWTAIPNFIDTERFHPRRPPSRSGLVVLCVAAIKRDHKRIDYLIRELADVPDARLILAGGQESDTESLKLEAERLLGDRVRFLVNHPRAQMPELYRSATVFVLPSLFEMMPIALLEACASGLPCITHDHPIMRWMAGPGSVAIDMSKDGALSAALREDHSSRGRLAREHCVAHFGTDAVIDQIRDYYRAVFRRSG